MIGCRDFIPAYSELFKQLEKLGGREAVFAFWGYLAERFLGNLRDSVVKNGIRGCWLYWSHTLNEEAADFTMELNEEEGWFRIIMHKCPSMGRLIESRHIVPYHDYCKHCDVIYRQVLEPLGYTCENDLSACKQATCSVIIRKKAG